MITIMIVMIRIIIMITFIKNDDNESNGRKFVQVSAYLWTLNFTPPPPLQKKRKRKIKKIIKFHYLIRLKKKRKALH